MEDLPIDVLLGQFIDTRSACLKILSLQGFGLSGAESAVVKLSSGPG
jgi:hypothetical protein